MLEYSELTVVKNADGISMALGYPINSFLLQSNKLLFGGGKKTTEDYGKLGVPAGLVCMTETVCRNSNEMGANEMTEMAEMAEREETELVPEGLYERLMELAEKKVPKKMTRRVKPVKKNKTHKTR